MLTVKGQISEPEKGVEYLHRGIAQRAFEHRFQLADHVKVVGAKLRNGLLDVELAREVPEAMKPRKIEIGGAPAQPRVIEARSQGGLTRTAGGPSGQRSRPRQAMSRRGREPPLCVCGARRRACSPAPRRAIALLIMSNTMPTPLVGVTSCLKSRDEFHFHSVGDKYVDAVVARRRAPSRS